METDILLSYDYLAAYFGMMLSDMIITIVGFVLQSVVV